MRKGCRSVGVAATIGLFSVLLLASMASAEGAREGLPDAERAVVRLYDPGLVKRENEGGPRYGYRSYRPGWSGRSSYRRSAPYWGRRYAYRGHYGVDDRYARYSYGYAPRPYTGFYEWQRRYPGPREWRYGWRSDWRPSMPYAWRRY